MKLLPEHGPCFICGTENPRSLGVRWYVREDGAIYTEVTLTAAQQGPPGHAHGGVLAALLDEIMGTAAWNAGYMVLAANINIDYRRPVPLNVPLQVTAVVSGKEGRKVFTRGELRLPDGTVATVGKGIFVEAAHLFVGDEGPSQFVRWLPQEE